MVGFPSGISGHRGQRRMPVEPPPNGACAPGGEKPGGGTNAPSTCTSSSIISQSSGCLDALAVLQSAEICLHTACPRSHLVEGISSNYTDLNGPAILTFEAMYLSQVRRFQYKTDSSVAPPHGVHACIPRERSCKRGSFEGVFSCCLACCMTHTLFVCLVCFC